MKTNALPTLILHLKYIGGKNLFSRSFNKVGCASPLITARLIWKPSRQISRPSFSGIPSIGNYGSRPDPILMNCATRAFSMIALNPPRLKLTIFIKTPCPGGTPPIFKRQKINSAISSLVPLTIGFFNGKKNCWKLLTIHKNMTSGRPKSQGAKNIGPTFFDDLRRIDICLILQNWPRGPMSW